MQYIAGAHSKGTWYKEGQAQEDFTRKVAFEQRREGEHGLVLQAGLAGEVRGSPLSCGDVKIRFLKDSGCVSSSGLAQRIGWKQGRWQ